MEVLIRVVLVFIFLQFLVVMTAMVVALLLARSEVPVKGRKAVRSAISRGHAFMVHLPAQALRSMARLPL